MADASTGNRRIKSRKRKNNHDFLVTGIGASAGGITALERLFEKMPSDSGIAFVVILRLSPERESNLAAMIQRKTSLSVMQVTEPVKVEPNHVYVIPPAKHLIMINGHIGFQEPVEISAAAKGEKDAGDVGPEMEPIVRQLEDELQRTKDQLRSVVEQYETSTEELRASNEELQAINEELRSASEELETGKEKLQALNEELSAINQELKDKVDEVSRSHSDLQNLFSATDIGTIFLDREMRLKRYTPNIQKIFNVIPSDMGRPLMHITHKLEYENLLDDARSALASLIRVEREVRSADGDWHIARLAPYRTVEDKIDGVALTLVDITQRKIAEAEREGLHEDLLKERALMDAVVRQMPAGVIIAEAYSGNIVFTNEQADLIWQAAVEKSGGAHFSSYLGYHEDGRPYAPEELPMSRAIKRGEVVRNEEIRLKRGDDGWDCINTSSSPIRDRNGNIIAGVATFYDATEQRRAESSLQYSQERLRLLVESIEDYAIFIIGRSGRIETWNPGAESIFGYSESEVLGQSGDIIFTPEDRASGAPEQEMSKALTEGRAEDERWHIRKDGSRFFASGVMSAMRGADSVGCVKILRDLTDRKQMEVELRRSRDELEERVKERTREIEEGYRALEAEVIERRAAEERVKELLRRVVDTQELERRRIARDLHDHLGQQMTALRLSLESLKEQTRGQSALHKQVRQIQAAAERVDKDVDFLAWELRPSTLDLLGLAATVESFVQEWSKHFSIPAEFHTTDLADACLSIESETNLYRIMQEALNNIYKHAEASRVAVMLEKRDKNVALIVEDDGKGFDPNEASSAGQGIGLISMRERASLTGGTLEIQSEPGAGTTIFARVPAHLNEEKA
jgi:two-component system, chemotaxis family, CheB/CheR fusion protein